MRLARDAGVDVTRLTRLVAESLPAHIPVTVEILWQDAS